MSKLDEDKIKSKMIDLYEHTNFFKVYGSDFWITIIFIIVSILLITFIYISNHFNKIKLNWDEERCNPLYLPFAGFINPQENKTNAEYTSENFDFCTKKVMKVAEDRAMSPIYSLTDELNSFVDVIKNSWNSVLGVLNIIKTKLMQLSNIVLSKLISVLTPIQYMFIKLKDTIAKMIGTLVASIYTFYTLYKVIKLYILNIIQIIITEILVSTLLALLATIGVLIAFIITWAVFMGLGFGFAASFFLSFLAPPMFAAAQVVMVTGIVSTGITLGIMLIFDIFIWIILGLLNNFSNQVFKELNTPPSSRQPINVKPDDIKDTSDESTNPLSNDDDSQQ